MIRRIVFTLPVVLLAFWIFWRYHHYSGAKLLHGNTISLIDHLRNDFIVRSRLIIPLKSISKEEMKNRWQKLAKFDSASVWLTNADDFIVENANHPRLSCNAREIQIEQNLFRQDIKPDHWSFYQDQVMVATATDRDPNNAHCLIDYQTYRESKTIEVTREELTHAQVYGLPTKPSKLLIFALNSPMIRATSADTILRRNGDSIPNSEWRYTSAPPVLLFQSSVLGVFKMFSASDVYSKELYVRGSLANFHIIATGDLAGSEFPRIGLYVDKEKKGDIEIRNIDRFQYSFVLPISEGHHLFELIFENDFYDPKTKADRNVGIDKVEIEYEPALVVKEPFSDRPFQYTIDYWRSDSASHAYYSDFVQERRRNKEWINAISTGIILRDELRRSLILGSGDKTEFPVEVPKSGWLEFGCGFRSQGKQKHVGLKVTLHRAFHLPVTLFSKELEISDGWTQTSIQLAPFAGEKIRLSFENTSSNKDSPTLVFASNPRIVSTQQETPPKLILLFSFDALRPDHLGAYGYRRATSPNIDAFAREAVLFENAYTAETWTLSSFASLFTSLYPSFHDVKEMNQSLNPSIPTLPKLLHDNGYFTGAFIDNPFLHPLYGFSKGFDSYNFHISDVEERVHSSSNWLTSSKSEKTFLFVHLISPHSPYTAPQRYVLQLAPETKGIFDSASYRRLLNRNGCEFVDPKDFNEVVLQYDAEIRQSDDLFRSMLGRIKELGLYDNALIILMSDHGEEFLDHGSLWHGSNVFTATARVPLIIKFPLKSAVGGVKIRDRVQLTDLMPTILELAGIHSPAELQGTSLLSALHSPSSNRISNRFLFTENRKGIMGIINDKYYYIYTDDQVSDAACPPPKTEGLYDLEADPRETRDLSSQLPDVLEMFRKQKQAYDERAAQFRKLRFAQNPVTIQPDAALREQMRALGYLQ